MAEAGKDKDFIVVPSDNDGDDWPDPGPQNPEEAEAYTDKIVSIFDTFGDLIHADNKNALPKMKLMAKHWASMEPADHEVVIRSIIDPGCLHLQQHLTREGPEAIDPVEDIPEPWTFICHLPKKQHRKEEKELIVEIFDHTLEALAHLLTVAAHFSLLTKIIDRETYHTVMNAAIQPLVKLSLPEKFLNLVASPVPQTTEEQRMEKVENTIFPRHDAACMQHKPKNGPTHILAAVVWLKLKRKFFNQGTVKEASELFKVRAKQLSRVITGKKYLGGGQKKGPKEHSKKGKSTRSHMAVKEPEEEEKGEEEKDAPPTKKAHLSKQ